MATKSETKQANQTRVQKVKAVHDEKMKERKSDVQTLRAEYLKLRDSPVLADIIAKSKSFASYHTTVARDGVGADKDGNIVYFEPHKRVSELDRAAGNTEISDYILRMIDHPAQKSMVQQVIDAEDDDNSEPEQGDERETSAE